mgnify:CR=1 FL=1
MGKTKKTLTFEEWKDKDQQKKKIQTIVLAPGQVKMVPGVKFLFHHFHVQEDVDLLLICAPPGKKIVVIEPKEQKNGFYYWEVPEIFSQPQPQQSTEEEKVFS